MFNKLIIFLSFFFFFSYCGRKKETTIIKKKHLTIQFPIDEEYVLVNNFINDSLLAFYCKTNRTLRIYNNTSREMVSQTNIIVKGEDIALITPDSLLVLDNSNLYINSQNYFVLHFLNVKNNQHDSIVFSDINFKKNAYVLDAIPNEFDLGINKKNDILIPCFADFNPESDTSQYKKWFRLCPDLKIKIENGKTKTLPFGKYPEHIVEYTNIFYPYRILNDEYTIYSHPYSSTILAIDNSSEVDISIVLRSKFITNFQNIPFDKLSDKPYILKYYIQNPMYYKILYSPYSDEYYRIVFYNFDSNGDLVNDFRNKSWGIIRFQIKNKKAKILDEKKFDGRMYEASQTMVTSKGILLQRREKLILNDTIQLAYDLLQF